MKSRSWREAPKYSLFLDGRREGDQRAEARCTLLTFT
jgi:hypothetical protein